MDYIEKIMSYDQKEADSMVGKKVELNWGECTIKDHVHYHFLLVRDSDGYFKMERAYYIIEEAKKNEEVKRLKEMDAFGRIFQEKGFFMEQYWSSNGKEFAIDGVLGGFFGKNDSGCMLDHVSVKCDLNSIDGYMEIGAGGRGYSYCHTFKADESKPCGYTAIRSSNDVDLDNQDWKPITELKDTMVEWMMEEFDKQVNLKGDFRFSKDKNGNLVFWEDNSSIGYRFLVEPHVEQDWHREEYTLQIGNIKEQPTNTKSGKAANGRRASWGDKWTLPKNAETIPGSEIREMIMAFVVPSIERLATRRQHNTVEE